ncbi:hypothetical protein O181_043122 [Austropuccinia psidii MF-1]|uniref:Enoyl-CoA hydratase n=1 Tax=Austropuccinia psidii MF-1 TaxID=1389203 RepID=A0A9Q3DJY0_9BASI|nr:hypothetical protein [Austropuccinia psidii MF-1]
MSITTTLPLIFRISDPMTSEHLPMLGPTVQASLLEHGRVLLVTMNRPKYLNAMTDEMEEDLAKILDHAESRPSIWVIIITGSSNPSSVRAFCAGQDLREWSKKLQSNQQDRLLKNPNGFGSLSRRSSRKPIVAAVDGLCLGGGLELMLNCDLVVATEQSKFGFPEVTKGTYVAQGGIPRLLQQCGRALACELLFLGRPISAIEARDRFRIVNQVTTSEDIMSSVLAIARKIILNSPTAVQLTKLALMDTFRFDPQLVLRQEELAKLNALEKDIGIGFERATVTTILRDEFQDWSHGRNLKEGIQSFIEKRSAVWTDPPSPKTTLNRSAQSLRNLKSKI